MASLGAQARWLWSLEGPFRILFVSALEVAATSCREVPVRGPLPQKAGENLQGRDVIDHSFQVSLGIAE